MDYYFLVRRFGKFRPCIALAPNDAGGGESGGSGGGGNPPPAGGGEGGGSGGEDTAGLKTALESERKRNKDLEKQFKQLQETIKGIDPEKYKQLEALQIQAEEWNQKEATLRTNLETTYTAQVKAESDRATAAETRYKALLARTQAESAFALSNGRSGGGEDGTTFFDSFYGNVAKHLQLNDKGVLEVVDNNGTRMFSKKDPSKPMSPAEFFSTLTSHPVYGHFFAPPNQSKGSGMNPNANRNFTQVDTSKMSRGERLTQARLAERK